MHTGRSLTVCGGAGAFFRGGGVAFLGRVGCFLPGGGASFPWEVVSQHALRQTPPPVNRITDTSKNITLATTSLRPVIIFSDLTTLP